MVNAYFNFLSLIQGQRPMEYQLMELEQFARAKKAGLQSTEGCEPSYQLATDMHETANTQLAFKKLSEPMFELLRLYIKYVRSTQALESAKRFLFINNNDHHIFNPSSGLGLWFWDLNTFINLCELFKIELIRAIFSLYICSLLTLLMDLNIDNVSCMSCLYSWLVYTNVCWHHWWTKIYIIFVWPHAVWVCL